MTIVGYIPARTGSKRLKNKNFKSFFKGLSITEIALKKSMESKILQFTLLDTNNKTFLENMKSKGLTDYFRLRKEEFSRDESLTKDSMIDCISKAEIDLDIKIDTIVLLQPTSPLISSNSIELIIDKFFENKTDLIASFTNVPVCINDCIKISNNKINKINLNLKKDDQVLFETGGIYIISKERLLNCKDPFYIDSLNNIYKIPMQEFVDVDCLEQFRLAKDIYKS